jgi:hypothetical protein
MERRGRGRKERDRGCRLDDDDETMSSAQDGTTPAAPAPVGPFETLSAMDPSRKYSLIFLMSVGTTLLLTGASGKRLLGRAQKATAPPSATPSPSSPGPSTVPRPSASTSTTRPRPPPPSPLSQTPRESSSQLQKWRYTVPLANSLDPDPLPQALKKNYDYFLPNATILARSSAFAERLDVEDRLHKDGPEEFGNEGSQVDDGFNPALFAGKAFAIASAITFTTFAVGVASVMAYFGVTSVRPPFPPLLNPNSN